LITLRPVFDILVASIADTNLTALVVNGLACVAPTPSHFRFGVDALRVLQEMNAGGASEFSEAVSFEIFRRLLGATLVNTEMSIAYKWQEWSKKTDYTCRVAEDVLAVSVTRAMKFGPAPFTAEDASRLLEKKLYGCQMSNRDVLSADRWKKQCLHILTGHQYIVDLLRTTFVSILEHTPELVGDTVVVITLTTNTPFLYYNFCANQSALQFVHGDTAKTPAGGAVSVHVVVLGGTAPASSSGLLLHVVESNLGKAQAGKSEAKTMHALKTLHRARYCL